MKHPTLPDDMHRNQHLITNDVERYMAEYEVGFSSSSLPLLCPQSSSSCCGLQDSGDPDVIGGLVLRLADWYLAWAPGGE
jgi:hypothetical protein